MTFDLSKIEGLTEEQQAAIKAMHETETQGLVSKTQELLSETKTAKATASEQAQALEQARQAAVKAEEEKLLAEGKYKEAQELREQERAQLVAEAESKAKMAQENLEKYHKGAALNGALLLIHDDFKDVSSALLDSMIKIDYNEQGEALTKFMKDGNVVANSVDEFKSWAAEQDSFKRIMNGVNSSGAGSSNANGSAGATNENSAYELRLKQAGLI
jgi:hypothetical protein